MLARIVPSNGEGTTIKGYGDFEDVGEWAVPAMQRMTAKKYIGGYNDGNLHPRDNLTRAQAAKIINDILNNYPCGPGWRQPAIRKKQKR